MKKYETRRFFEVLQLYSFSDLKKIGRLLSRFPVTFLSSARTAVAKNRITKIIVIFFIITLQEIRLKTHREKAGYRFTVYGFRFSILCLRFFLYLFSTDSTDLTG